MDYAAGTSCVIYGDDAAGLRHDIGQSRSAVGRGDSAVFVGADVVSCGAVLPYSPFAKR